MLSGHFQGRVLSLISKLIRPKTILEIGTYTGYATLCLAEGLTTEGIIHTIDVNEELQDLQREFFDRSGKGNQIVQHLGAAADIIPTLDANFDLVFIDADKQNYALYFDLIINKMRSGGIILSDNVLWSGKVVSPIKSNDKQTLAIDLYNKKINNDPRVETVLLPIRDGLTVSRVV
ncbi:O-methyltransferase mdmC [Capnocytophaga canimorsus Cc5]|uniref:O-methyltransferase mdmC n=2 Tax=Capnocytophaga canimorsus TaxID=28188 RepID=F9YQJ1_CAPCC|nr:O-methyltransferase mdmC [Capnocytophaga canimorsus Cc5]